MEDILSVHLLIEALNMDSFNILIENIQHIKKLSLEIDLTKPGIFAIVGKNGVGKTTLFKAIDNLITSNTFANTSSPHIYNKDSKITYTIDNDEYIYSFKYNKDTRKLDNYDDIEAKIINNIHVELPIPFGRRFKQFKRLSNVDKEMRLKIITEEFTIPTELIQILNYIYDTERFDDLKEINIGSELFYALVVENRAYIREDYLSSSEYFVITMYKLIIKKCKFLAIDEIDISLDASAQVRFVDVIRTLALQNNIKIFFSTHSLALIKTLKNDELFYMNFSDGLISFDTTTHSYIQTYLYGFHDYEKDFIGLKEIVDLESKPLIITEGKTDWMHLKKALSRFQENVEYEDLDIKFLEYEDDIKMGDSTLNLMLDGFRKTEQTKKIIFIFDRDNSSILSNYSSSTDFICHGNNVYSFCIPKISEELNTISIEFFYNMEDLKTEDESGRRLFLGTDFYKISGNSKCGKFQMHEKNKAEKQVIIDSRVYNKDDYEWKHSIALSKNDFVNNIIKERDNFNDFNLDKFKLIFDIIRKIVID